MTREEIKQKYAAKFKDVNIGDKVYLFETIDLELLDNLHEYDVKTPHIVEGKETEEFDSDGDIKNPAYLKLREQEATRRIRYNIQKCLKYEDFEPFMEEYIPIFIARLKTIHENMIEESKKEL
jgi:hypothetical protein